MGLEFCCWSSLCVGCCWCYMVLVSVLPPAADIPAAADTGGAPPAVVLSLFLLLLLLLLFLPVIASDGVQFFAFVQCK